MSALLQTDHPRSLRGWLAFVGRPTTGRRGAICSTAYAPARRHAPLFGVDVWRYGADKPDEAAVFNAAMSALSRNVAPAIIAAGDFSRFRRIVDLGGANGALLAAILAATPGSGEVVSICPTSCGRRP